ncbi:MAG: GNAT family N-acetyltransferase [Lachnospiraceae bacterium]|nr:GNAT family N-acetyltransferase [Lachnospiraceae bacterium]
MKELAVIKNYRNDEALRHSFNELAKKTFWIDFEDWYQNGYWTDKYNPYSIVLDGKVVANVSVNQTDIAMTPEVARAMGLSEGTDAQERVLHYIQLGTVMTDEAYRGKGLSRRIMEEIMKDYPDADGMYLFGNDNVCEFYPKFGFCPVKHYEYVKEVHTASEPTMKQVPMKERADWDKLQAAIERSYHQSVFEMVNNSELNMFYVTKYMQDDVYFSEELDAYVIAEIEDGELTVNMVISEKPQDMNRIVEGFGKEIRRAVLGFTPQDATGFELREAEQVREDCTFFVKGEGIARIAEAKVMFPLLAHA